MTRLLAALVVLVFVCARPADAQTGTVSGTVIRASNSAPIVGGGVTLCAGTENCVYTSTNAAGAFTFTVAPGTYYAYTSTYIGLINEVYDNVQCLGECFLPPLIAQATPIVVTSGGTVSGRNFALEESGFITGTVKNAATLAPLAGVAVEVYKQEGLSVLIASSATTDATGAYSVQGLTSGTYYASTFNTQGFINEIYDNVTCPGQCLVTMLDSGTPIPVTAGATTPNRDFLLSPGGSVTGTIRNHATSALVPGVSVVLVSLGPSGAMHAGAATSNASGVYTIGALPSGTYYAYTSNNLGLVNEWYDDVPCVRSCSSDFPPNATPITVTSPAVASGKDFRLDPGGSITGTVVNSVTAAPVAGVTIYAYARLATGAVTIVRQVLTNGSGAYTIPGLATANYYLATANDAGLVNEVFDNLPCAGGCNSSLVAAGTPVAVTVGTTTPGKDFGLQPGGVISGTVLITPGNTPVTGGYVGLWKREAVGQEVYIGITSINGSGAYQFTGLLGGTYFAFTQIDQAVDEIYSGTPCLGDCYSVMSTGTPISVTTGLTTGGINFSPRMGGRISGVVRNAATSAGLPNLYVTAFRSLGTGHVRQIAAALTNGAGQYSIGGLNTGDYFLVTSVSGFDNQVYAGISCAGLCSAELAIARGTPVPVTFTGTTTGIDFALTPLIGRVAGTITDATTSAPLAGISVYAYSRSGADHHFVGGGMTNAAGIYEMLLPPGTYQLAAVSTNQHQGETYDNIPCLTTCYFGAGPVTVGTPVTVTTGTVTANFALAPFPASPPGPPDDLWGRVAGATVKLEWYPSFYGPLATDYILDAGFAPGTTALSIVVAGTTFETSGVPPGRYFLRVRGRNASGIGPPSGEFELVVNADGSGAPGHPETLEIYVEGSRLFANWSEPWYGGFPTEYVIEAGTAPGLSNLGAFPVGTRTHFELEPPPPPGVYFVRVRGRNALGLGPPSREIRLVVGGVPAPPEAPGNLNFAVDPSRTVTVAWTAPRGTVTGYVLEVGNASERYNLGAFPLSAASTFFTTGPVPPGLYFVRIRARNASGPGVASSERVLYVP